MRFLTVSLIVVIGVCIVMFTALGIFMNRKSTETIDDVGTIYMEGMNERISMHFETIIGMRLSYLESVINDVPPESAENYDDMCQKLVYNATTRILTISPCIRKEESLVCSTARMSFLPIRNLL